MIKKFTFLFVFTILTFSCKEQITDANAIIDKSIEISGGALFNTSNIQFDFRDKHYLAKRNQGNYLLERISVKDDDSIFDSLTNNGFERSINEVNILLPDSIASNYGASVNSVHYFSVLPFGLNTKAVNKEYSGKVALKDKDYHKIKVSFNQEGGGEDFEDVFIYWINTETYKVDYLAYSYNENDGLGLRFREAYNERYINGIRFVDYNNYKPTANTVLLEDLGDLFEKGKLELLSKIELKNVAVSF